MAVAFCEVDGVAAEERVAVAGQRVGSKRQVRLAGLVAVLGQELLDARPVLACRELIVAGRLIEIGAAVAERVARGVRRQPRRAWGGTAIWIGEVLLARRDRTV